MAAGGSRSLLLRPEAPALNDPARDEAFDEEEEAEEAPLAAPDDKRDERTPHRVLALFWLLGVLNNASYVIMIASAKSIASGGVALVYIAAGVPGVATKLSAPLWFDRVGYGPRLGFAAACMAGAFALVGPLSFGRTGVQLSGVLLCSVQAALGEASLLALASRSPGRGSAALGAWSSGTGFAGIFGYAWVFLCTRVARLGLAATQAAALAALPGAYAAAAAALAARPPRDGGGGVAPRPVAMGPATRLRFALGLWPVTGAIFAVYFAEYAMQSGVWASMGFPDPRSAARRDAFYLYSNWLYQGGVLCSRSSGFLYARPVPRAALWAMAAAQCGLLAFFAFDAADHFWYDRSVLALCFVVGLFGGAVYVHGFRALAARGDDATAELAMPVGAAAADAGTLASNVVGLFLQACLYDANRIGGATVSWSICSDGVHPTSR